MHPDLFSLARLRLRPLSLVALLFAALPLALAQTPAKKILFFDDEDVLFRSGTKRTINQLAKHDADPSTPDVNDALVKPGGWATTSKSLLSLCSVSFEPNRNPRYQMWYQVDSSAVGFTGSDKAYDNVVAYAHSSDGVTWTKPDLHLQTGFLFPNASGPIADNNIVLLGVGSTTGKRAGCSVLYDPADPNPLRRYKMVFSDWAAPAAPELGLGLQVAFSPDGVIWTKHIAEDGWLLPFAHNHRNQVVPQAGQDAYLPAGPRWAIPMTFLDNVNVFRDGASGKYVIYGRMPIEGPTGKMNYKYGMGRSESVDFIEWSAPRLVLAPDDGDLKTADSDPSNDFDISFQDSPVFHYDGHYLCLNQLLDTETGTTEIELMSSRDGYAWNRLRRKDHADVRFLPRGPVVNGVFKDFDSRYIYTSSSVVVGTHFRFYYGGYGNKTGIGFAHNTRDRLVGLKADWTWLKKGASTKIEPTGQVTLKPLDLGSFASMKLNVAIESGGSVKVELLDPLKYRVTGYTKDDCVAITTGSTAAEVSWGTNTLSALPDGEYLVRIHLYKATLYGCGFHP